MTRWKLAIALPALAIALALAQLTSAAAGRKPPPPQGFFSRLLGLRDPNFGFFGPANPPDFTLSRPRKPRANIVNVPAPDTVVIQPKDADAKKILVVGDYVGGGLAWGLEQELADETKLAVVDRSNSGSGLIRPDFYDWNKSLPEILNREKPDIVIVALGSNDRQQLRVGNERFAIRSDEWEKGYLARVDGLVETLKVYGRPFFWVGAPPVRNEAISADMAYLNGLFKAHVEAGGGSFVDIWNGFADANGAFISAGPDAEGQVRPLRTGDGINFTRAGRVKLGFFVQRDLRRKTGVGVGAIDLAPSKSQASHIEVGPDGKKILVGPVISLTDPLPTTATLAGGPDNPVPAPQSAQFKVIVKGETPATVAGRVDDYVWPAAPTGTTAPLPGQPAPAAAPN